tara:strand:- start:811 stop:927 length:117 start_codon:yes stop_codon:yes gene_type:complete
MPESNVVYSNGVGNAWHGQARPDVKRKMDTDKKKKGKK